MSRVPATRLRPQGCSRRPPPSLPRWRNWLKPATWPGRHRAGPAAPTTWRVCRRRCARRARAGPRGPGQALPLKAPTLFCPEHPRALDSRSPSPGSPPPSDSPICCTVLSRRVAQRRWRPPEPAPPALSAMVWALPPQSPRTAAAYLTRPGALAAAGEGPLSGRGPAVSSRLGVLGPAPSPAPPACASPQDLPEKDIGQGSGGAACPRHQGPRGLLSVNPGLR